MGLSRYNRVIEHESKSLNNYPTQIFQFTQKGPIEIIFPDMHSNPLGRMNLLMQLGLIKMSQKNYAKLAKIYSTQMLHNKPLLIDPSRPDAKQIEEKYQQLRALFKPMQPTDDRTAVLRERYRAFIDFHFQYWPEEKTLIKKDVEEFAELLNAIIVDEELVKKITLIDGGDEVADRGSADIFTLLYFGMQTKLNIKFNHCLISNHGMEFVSAYEPVLRKYDGFKKRQATDAQIEAELQTQRLHPTGLDPIENACSMMATQRLLDQGHISWLGKGGLIDLIETHYKPRLTPLHYTLCKDEKGDVAKISIRSHAAIDVETIVAMARVLEIEGYKFRGVLPSYDKIADVKNVRPVLQLQSHVVECAREIKTSQQLAILIDKIIAKVKQHVANNTLSTLYIEKGAIAINQLNRYEDHKNLAFRMLVNFTKLYFPFDFSVWNRVYCGLKRESDFIEWTHGHDSDDPIHAPNIFSIDGKFGKFGIDGNKGYILYSQSIPIPDKDEIYRMVPLVAPSPLTTTMKEEKINPIQKISNHQLVNVNIIVKVINEQNDNAILLEMYQTLLEKSFDYLRECVKSSWSYWRSVAKDAEGVLRTVSTTQSWAAIEKAFELRALHNLKKDSFGKPDKKQLDDLKKAFPFMGAKHKIGFKFWKKHNDTFAAVLAGDEKEFQKKSDAHFKKYMTLNGCIQ